MGLASHVPTPRGASDVSSDRPLSALVGRRLSSGRFAMSEPRAVACWRRTSDDVGASAGLPLLILSVTWTVMRMARPVGRRRRGVVVVVVVVGTAAPVGCRVFTTSWYCAGVRPPPARSTCASERASSADAVRRGPGCWSAVASSALASAPVSGQARTGERGGELPDRRALRISRVCRVVRRGPSRRSRGLVAAGEEDEGHDQRRRGQGGEERPPATGVACRCNPSDRWRSDAASRCPEGVSGRERPAAGTR